MLALGLNIVVGWGGLLDLGFVAFFGIGAYTYAMLDSDKFGIHLPTLVAVPLVVLARRVVGLAPRPALAAADRRLPRDRDALLLTVVPDADEERRRRLRPQHHGRPERDPEGRPVPPLRPISRLEHGGVFAVSYLYVALAFFVVVYVALRFVNLSRTGRAWRSQREDPLAAEPMGMPVNWLKLMSFVFGAAVAAFTGTLFAGAERQRLPADLLLRAADHRLHDGDPRRLRQPGRGRARRDHHQRPARAAARPGQVAARLRRFVLGGSSRRSASRRSSRSSLAADHLRLRLHGSCARHRRGVGGRAGGRRLRTARSRTGSSCRRTSTAGSRPSRTSG